MNDKYRATLPELEAQIKMVPAESLSRILIAVINQCIKLKLFQNKPVHKVVETLEKKLKGL